MFDSYRLDLDVERLVGGIPKHPEIVKRWQEARWKDNPILQVGDPATPEEAAERTIELLGDQISDEEKGIWTTFVEHPDGGFAIESRQVKAMLKEAANVLRTMLPVHGKVIPLRARLAERVFVEPNLLPVTGVLNDDGELPTGTIERPIHVMTARGPRTALKRTDYIDRAQITCTLKVLKDGMFDEKLLVPILDYATKNGLGTDRSQGAGVFTYTLTRES